MHSLLDDPLIDIDTPDGPASVALPALLGGLVTDRVLGYSGLRAHQADPWHVFLVQIAASILARQPEIDPAQPPTDAAFWRAGLLDLAEGMESAWHLVVEDPTQPAFMQHPLRNAAELNAFESKARTPDELDILVTSKNHDVKMARARADDPQTWLFALMIYQTMSGVLGARNYGSMRMNSGSASRPIVGMVRDLVPAPRFREELAQVADMRTQTLESALGYAPRGVVLTWVRPWGRKDHQYSLSELEPGFIEAVRPVRLIHGEAGLIAMGSTSDVRQIGPKALGNGDIADPWIPINTADKKKGRSALTLSGQGWTPERLCDVLFERGFELTALQKPRPGQGALWFYGSVLVRGQGTTEGFHRFAIPVPAKARGWLSRPDDKQRLGALAQDLIGDAKSIARQLRSALLALAEGGPDAIDFKHKAINAWIARGEEALTRHWRDRFFDTLWRAADDAHDAVRTDWRAELIERATLALTQAEQTLPLPHNRQYRARVRAEGLLHALLKKNGLIPAPATPAPTKEDAA